MDTRTGEIRELAQGQRARKDEVELTAEQAAEALELEPAERLTWWERLKAGGALVTGKDRKRAHMRAGPDLPPEHRRAVLAAGDHRKAAKRRAEKHARRVNRPRVKRRSRAHAGHGKG